MADLRERLQQALAGRYTLERELGRGGMSTVFLATDLNNNGRVGPRGGAGGAPRASLCRSPVPERYPA